MLRLPEEGGVELHPVLANIAWEIWGEAGNRIQVFRSSVCGN